MLKQKKNRKGFTLVELMVVVVIIGILTAIAIPVYMSVTANAEAKSCQANQRTIDSAVMVWKAENVGNDVATLAVSSVALMDALVPTYLAEIPVCPTLPDDLENYTVDGIGLCHTGCGIDSHILHTVEVEAEVTTQAP